MTTQNITFTKTNLTENPITVEIEEIDFPAQGGTKKIAKIEFVGKEVDKIKTILKDNQKIQLTFEDSELKVDENINLTSAGAGASHTASASKGGTFMASEMNSAEEIKKAEPNKLMLKEDENKLVVFYNEDGKNVKLAVATETDTGDQTGGGPDKKIPEPDKTNKPTQAEIDQAKQALDNANTPEEMTVAADKVEELKSKGAVDSEFDTKVEAMREKVFNSNKEGYRQAAETKITTTISEYEISESDLDDTEKTDFTKLKGKQITEKAQIDEKETQIINNVKKKGTDKKWTALENEVKNALKTKDKDKLTKAETDLNNFIKDSKYSAKKSDAQSLLSQVKNANTGGGGGKGGKNEDTPFYRNPKIMIPVALVGVALIALAIWFVRSNRSSQEE